MYIIGVIIGIILLIMLVMFLAVLLLWILNGIMFLTTWLAIVSIIVCSIFLIIKLAKKDFNTSGQILLAIIGLFIVFGISDTLQPKLHNYLTKDRDTETTTETVLAESEGDEIVVEVGKADVQEATEDITEGADSDENELEQNEDVEIEVEEVESNIKSDEEIEGKTKEEIRETLESHFVEMSDLTNFITDIKIDDDSFWDYTVYVVNEVKLSSNEEKTYMIEEIGPAIRKLASTETDLEISKISITFKYQDGKILARQKAFSNGWNIKE